MVYCRWIAISCGLSLAFCATSLSQDNANDNVYRLLPAANYAPYQAEYLPAQGSAAGPELSAPAFNNPYANQAAEPLPAPAYQNYGPPTGYDNTPPLATPLPNSSGPNGGGAYQPPAENLPPTASAPVGPEDVASDVAPPDATAQAAVDEVIVPNNSWYSYFDPWEGNVELGMNGTAGNTETFNLRVGGNAKYTGATTVHSLQVVYLEKSVNEVNTAQNALLDSRLEWPWEGSPWNVFIHGLGEYDQFKAFDARLSGDAGLGFEWIKNDFTTFVTRTGVAFSHEIGGPESEIIPEFLAGMEYKHKFSDTHSISFKTDYYPAMEDTRDFRLNTQASWEMAVAPDWGLSLKFSVIDRYDSTPHGAKPNDLDYSTLLIWGF